MTFFKFENLILGDIRNDVTQERAIDLAIKDNRKLVGLILNAGTVQPLSRISALWDKQDIIDAFDINVFSNLSLIRRALPHLRKFGGRILATTSGVVQVPLMGWSIYTSSKTALNSIIEILAKEEANSGIASIVAMEPGIVDTEMFREAAGMPTETLDPDYVSWIKNVQLLKPEEPAESMAKLILKAPKEKSGKYISWNEPWIKEL